MKASARNAIEGQVTALTPGAVNAEVEVTSGGGDKFVAVITMTSVKEMRLAIGSTVTVLVKAPWVIIVRDDEKTTFSARNRLAGKVAMIRKGAINAEVSIGLPGGAAIHAVITNDALDDLALAVGQPASALIKASHVVLAVSEP
jgi:molybdate transport system regulatory protein